MAKVAIVGATGPTGIHLAAELRKTDVAGRLIARGTDKLARLLRTPQPTGTIPEATIPLQARSERLSPSGSLVFSIANR